MQRKRKAGALTRRFQKRQRAMVVYAPRNAGRLRIGGVYGRFSGPNAEMKFLDTTVGTTTIATTGTLLSTSLLVIPQNNTESGRIGRKCTVKQLSLKGNIDLAVATLSNQTSDVLRIIVYVDKQTNGIAATVGGILATATYNSFRNLSETGRFSILMDKSYGLQCPAGQGDGVTFSFSETARPWSMNRKLNLPIEYDASATTGVLTTIRSSNIGVMAISKAGIAKFDFVARVRYSDAS